MAILFSNRVPKEVLDRIIYRSEKLGIEPDWFMFLGDWESGLSSTIENSCGCVGVIQFCADKYSAPCVPAVDYKTINGKRYKLSDIKNMPFVQQIDLAFDYLEEQRGVFRRFASYSDLYFAILYPSAIGKPDDYVLNTQSNPVFDINPKDGKVTVGEVKQYLDNRVREKDSKGLFRVPQQYWNIFFKKKTFGSCIKMKSSFGEELRLVA